MSKRKKYFFDFLILVVFTLVIIASLIKIIFTPTDRKSSELFSKIVYFPIPESVTNIKASEYRTFRNNYRYIFRFNINPEDLTMILASRPFREVTYYRYRQDHISYEEGNSNQVVSIWFDENPPPRWFELGEWKKFKAYGINEIGGDLWYRLLVYNEELEEAYYIDKKLHGGVGIRLFDGNL